MANLAMEFTHRLMAVKFECDYNSKEALSYVSEEYKKVITAIAIRKRIDETPPQRRYYFKDGTSFTLTNGIFEFHRSYNTYLN